MKTLLERAPGTLRIARAADRPSAGRRSNGGSNRRPFVSAGLLVLAAAAIFAMPARAGADHNADLAFDCTGMHLPSQQDVARLLGTHNFDQTYRERERLMRNVRRECLRGARQVVVKADTRVGQAAIEELAEAH